MKKPMPVTKEQVEESKERLKAINAQPIKKIAEAKARKQRKVINIGIKGKRRESVCYLFSFLGGKNASKHIISFLSAQFLKSFQCKNNDLESLF